VNAPMMDKRSSESPAMHVNPHAEGRQPPLPTLPEPYCAVRELSGQFHGQTVRYRAVAGETYVRDEKGTAGACFFTIAYLRSDAQSPASRPVMFIFNGGPGSSAQWLHMGVFGPKRVNLRSEPIQVEGTPHPIVDNDASVLDVSDLVFIDPIGTGYSRAVGGTDPKQYWGLMEDARSIAAFIETWLTCNQRWISPKYLAGESYGTTRACLVAELLQERFVGLKGILLISAVLDYQNSRPRTGDGGILSYASFLPTFAATAWYHGKVGRAGRTLDSFLNEVRRFARTEYAHALIANRHRLDSGQYAQLILRLASYTGLDQSYIARSELRIPVHRFFKELLRDRGLVIGRLDGRYTGVEPESAGESAESDPTVDAIGAAVTCAMHLQLDELGVRVEPPYVSISSVVETNWNWLSQEKALNGGGYVNVVPHLGRAMRHNGELRVLVACGYYDFSTPFFGAENALSQDGVVHERIRYTYYEVGHLLFLHEPSRVQFLDDVRRFIQDADRASSKVIA
jgi:carboxypeptidase C (cathepsin A)